jgi:hypothetical protein
MEHWIQKKTILHDFRIGNFVFVFVLLEFTTLGIAVSMISFEPSRKKCSLKVRKTLVIITTTHVRKFLSILTVSGCTKCTHQVDIRK